MKTINVGKLTVASYRDRTSDVYTQLLLLKLGEELELKSSVATRRYQRVK